MDCSDFTELSGGYLAGKLEEAAREEFEAHYLACPECFRQLARLAEIRDALRQEDRPQAAATPRLGHRSQWGRVGLAAVLVLVAAGTVLLILPSRQPAGTIGGSGAAVPERPAVIAPAARPVERDAREERLQQLARIDPPVYAPSVLRGMETDAESLFRQAMALYQRGNYRQASPLLLQVEERNPGVPRHLFYLGVCGLLSGDTAAGTARLERVVATGDTPYLEEALWLLAKVCLGRGDTNGAVVHLRRVAALRGDLEPDARRMLAAIAGLEHDPGTPAKPK